MKHKEFDNSNFEIINDLPGLSLNKAKYSLCRRVSKIRSPIYLKLSDKSVLIFLKSLISAITLYS